MSSELVGDHEKQDIRQQVSRILKDLDNPEPPLSLPLVRELLKLDLQYYSSTNTTHVQEVTHRLRVAGKQIASRPMILFDAIKKAKLSALWVPDAKRILIDEEVPDLKHRWIEAHEITHSVTPWHQQFLFGDTEYTLDPACHAIVEAEANFGAGRLLFLEDRFAHEARDVELNFSNIRSLAKRYGNTITSTLWRIVEDREPNLPVFGMITVHPRHPTIGATESGKPVQHFIRSSGFSRQFPNVSPRDAYRVLSRNASFNKAGPIVDMEHTFVDSNGNRFDFRIESFSNSHALLTYGVMLRQHKSIVQTPF